MDSITSRYRCGDVGSNRNSLTCRVNFNSGFLVATSNGFSVLDQTSVEIDIPVFFSQRDPSPTRKDFAVLLMTAAAVSPEAPGTVPRHVPYHALPWRSASLTRSAHGTSSTAPCATGLGNGATVSGSLIVAPSTYTYGPQPHCHYAHGTSSRPLDLLWKHQQSPTATRKSRKPY